MTKTTANHAKGDSLWAPILVACALALVPAAVRGAIREVPSASYPTLQAAYQAAAAGDIIRIQSKLYLETPSFVDLGKEVLFEVANGPAIVTAQTPLTNDAFLGRTPLAGRNVSVRAENYVASLDPDPVPQGCVGNGNCTNRLRRGIWFEWTAPANGLAVVSTFGSDFQTMLQVYRGNHPDCLSVQNELLWGEFLNEVGFNAKANVPYQILVGGLDGAYGQIALDVTMPTPPANDNFAAAYPLAGTRAQVQGTTIASTFEELEPNHAGLAGLFSVWFSWTAPSGDAIAPRPVTISTAGSDFNTILAVYEGASLDRLALQVANDDSNEECCPFTSESEVTFTPTPRHTYHIVVADSNGASSARDKLGNYRLRVDYSVVDWAVQQLSKRTDVTTGEVSFSAAATVSNWGLAPTGPLRVRLVARNGPDFVGLHHASAAGEITLSTSAVASPDGLASGAARSLTLSGTCPGPLDEGGAKKPWGVFAVVEELFAGQWVPVDSEFLLYGAEAKTELAAAGMGHSCGGLGYSLSRPVPSALADNQVNQVVGFDIQASDIVTDRSTNSFALIALLDNHEQGAIASATWSGPSYPWLTLTSGGTLRIADIPQTTSLSITGRCNLGGVWRSRIDVVPVYKRPRLILLPTNLRNNFLYVIQADFSAAFTLEYKDDLRNSTWLSNTIGTFYRSPTTNQLVGTNLNGRFYRLNIPR